MSVKYCTKCCSSKEPMYFMYAKWFALKAITSKWKFSKHCLLISAFCGSIKDRDAILQCTAPCDNTDPEGHRNAQWVSLLFNGCAYFSGGFLLPTIEPLHFFLPSLKGFNCKVNSSWFSSCVKWKTVADGTAWKLFFFWPDVKDMSMFLQTNTWLYLCNVFT